MWYCVLDLWLKQCDNTMKFWQLLSSTCAVSRCSLFLQLCSPFKQAEGVQEARRILKQESWLKLTKGTFHNTMISNKNWGKGDFQESRYFSKNGWPSVHLWKVVSDCLNNFFPFFFLFPSHINLSLYQPRTFLAFPIICLSEGRGSEQAAVWCLAVSQW